MEIHAEDNSLQFKYNDIYPSKSTLFWSKKHLYEIWPELQEYDSSIVVLYAGLGTPPFHRRKIEDVAEEIRHEYSLGKRNFIFQCLDEGFSFSNIILIEQVCNHISDIFPNISVIYATGSYDGADFYEKWCQKNNVKTRNIKIIAGDNFGKNCKKFLSFKKEYQVGLRIKKFLCFNKEDRQHRISLFEKLLSLNLVEQSHYSFSLNPEVLENVLKKDSLNRYSNILKIANKLPLVLNRGEERPNPADVRSDDLIYFESSYFSVVNETLFYGMTRNPSELYINIPEIFGNFPSEKIYKCIALNHPFIVTSTPRFLQSFRDKGYKTFHPYIDETYDTVDNDYDRLNMIVKEIHRLCMLSDDELIEFTKNVKSIVEYNSKYYSNLENFRITENVVDLLK